MQTLRDSHTVSKSIAAALLLLTLSAAGCSEHRARESASLESNAPAGALLGPTAVPGTRDLTGGGMTLIPIAVGQRWDYRVFTSSRLVSPDSPEEVTRTATPWRTEIAYELFNGGVQYFAEANYDPRQLDPPVGQFYLVREDASGRYYLDQFVVSPAAREPRDAGVSWVKEHEVAVRAAAARSPHRAAIEAAAARASAVLHSLADLTRLPGAPFPHTGLPARGMESGRLGSPRPGEISHLLYPLFRGSRWIVRDSPRFTRSIVGRERLSLPAGEFDAWAIRGGSEFFGPNDRVFFHYAEEGLVRMQVRLEAELVDEQGNPIGRYVTETDQLLEQYTPGFEFTQN